LPEAVSGGLGGFGIGGVFAFREGHLGRVFGVGEIPVVAIEAAAVDHSLDLPSLVFDIGDARKWAIYAELGLDEPYDFQLASCHFASLPKLRDLPLTDRVAILAVRAVAPLLVPATRILG